MNKQSTSSSSLEAELKTVTRELDKIEDELERLKTKQRQLSERKNYLKDEISKEKSRKLATVDWAGTEYAWTDEVKRTLKNVFKIEKFRAKQLSAINSTLSDQHVIVVMPTGAGKSLCYQLPALVKPGITIVVSPLISLMEDQIRSLHQKNVEAKLISSSSSKEETNAALNDLKEKNSKLKLLYVTPERFAKSRRFMSNLQKCFSDKRLQRIAIDEVHCCSQWGHDFRPDYKFLGVLVSMFPGVPILGLTATATAYVINDVQKMLKIPGCLVIKSTFNRPNLYYRIIEKPKGQQECLNILEKLLKHRYKNETGIIYTNSIKDCEEIAVELRKRSLKVNCYHANMEANKRIEVHIKWHEKKYQAIVATIAFGMGIDKPDVRFVIHHTISKSIENYYQESGRAGRDGFIAECIILYRLQDVFKNSTMVFSTTNSLDHLYGMVKYCLNSKVCRRQILSQYFDEDWGTSDCNKMCDVCEATSRVVREINITKHCQDIRDIIDKSESNDVKLTAQKLIDIWFQKGLVKLRIKSEDPKIPRELAEDIVAYLLTEGYLVEDFHFTAYSTISYIKNGPNMACLDDNDFTLKMFIRKYQQFDMASLLCDNMEHFNCYDDDIDVIPKKKIKIVLE